jgi:hypothetical protein
MTTGFIVRARQMRYMLYTLFALIVADGILTDFLVIQKLGQEWNPFLKNLVGGEQFLLIKVCGALLIIIIMYEIYKKRPGMAIISSLCFLVLYTGIIYWNSFVFITGAF